MEKKKWSLYRNDSFLEPLKFSNGKTQEDVVNEVLESIENGKNIIFIKGVCGTGKSAIALNLAKNLGKSSIVVPGKALQKQYKADYEGDKFVLKDSNQKLKISVITGRKNHPCKFAEQNDSNESGFQGIPKIKKEIDSNLENIFEFSREELEEREEKKNGDKTADRWDLPCKIEIKERNWQKIREYLKQNKNINHSNFQEIRDVKRASVAVVCPYWSPVVPEKYNFGKIMEGTKQRTYNGLNGEVFTIYSRKEGCSFYSQYNSYIDSDVIVFNSLKYKLESAMNRKPLTEVEIIDECDEFLDSFSNQRSINIDRMQASLGQVVSFDPEVEKTLQELNSILKHLKRDERIMDSIVSGKVLPLRETGIYDIVKMMLEEKEFLNEVDEESYLYEIEEASRMFEGFLEETYVSFSKNENSLIASLVTTNLSKKFQDMVEKNKIVVLMSGTLHSDDVLRDIYGLESFSVIDAETSQQGSIDIKKTGLEMDCKYSNFSSGRLSRSDYLLALDKCVEVSEKPTLIHVNSFTDLPTISEKENLDLKNLICQNELRESQDENDGKEIQDFKSGKIEYLFTTRCARGVDFPGEQCKSIIFTKYPNPNVQDPFWKILSETKPNHYWAFYKDKARRELLQKIYRGLRFKEDHIYLLSPDSRVLDFFEGGIKG